MKKDFLSVSDLNKREIFDILKETKELKKQRFSQKLRNKNIALIFQKSSTRTRASFEVGINQLGGNAIILNWNELQLGRGETVEDTARVLERYCDAIIARVFDHKDLIKMSKVTRVPIINSLSDLEHPCQIISDLFTIYEHFGSLKNLKLAYIGDGNNVCNSLILGCAIAGMNISIATPRGYEPNNEIVKLAKKLGNVSLFNDPYAAAKNSSVLYTDAWISMGQEKEKKERLKIFKPYQLNRKLLNVADKNIVVMHCLPAHRGLEITDDVTDGKHSIIFTQAENRLHVQKAILLKILKRD